MPLLYNTEQQLLTDLDKIKSSHDSNSYPYLTSCLQKFCSNEKLFPLVSNIQLINLLSIVFWKIADNLETKDPWSNSVDPLTFILGAAYTEAESLAKYAEAEEQRQKEKSISGHIGYFTQGLIRLAFRDSRSLLDLYENDSSRFDVESQNGAIAIEVKSKWNTTKGDSREAKYKSMWDMKANFQELYFAEILAKPKHNYATEKSLINSEKWPNFWRCNGEFIYQRAAEIQQIKHDESFLKTLYINFPGVLWVFFKLLQLNQKELEETNSNISKFQAWARDELQTNKFKTPEHKSLMEIFSNISTESGVENILNCESKLAPKERRRAKDLIILQKKLINLNILSKSIQTSIEKFSNDPLDLAYLTDKLLGHL